MKGKAVPSLNGSGWQPANHKEGATLSDSWRESEAESVKSSEEKHNVIYHK